MTYTAPTLDRRAFDRDAAATGLAALAGCSVLGGTGDRPVDLAPPENYETLKNSEVPYPIYGEKLPEATVQDPLAGEEISTRHFVDERHTLLTFVYTRCGSICPALTGNQVHVQADAAERGYSDEVALLAMTFDPPYDDAERLREVGRERGADVSADNWRFLRPQSEGRVDELVVETFGHPFQENPGDGMPFLHDPLWPLANDRGYIERAYANTVPDPFTVVEDVRTFVEG